ncbi:nucleotide disphospho-sugar-binding domain-containing protein [Crossiella sp. NPDC003009]
MRILFTTWAWPSHYYPMVPLAWACRAAGHEVRIASTPGLQPVIRASGLPGVSVGADVDLVGMVRQRMRGGGQGGSFRGLAMFVTVAEAMVDELAAFGRSWRPDLVVYEPTTYAGPLVAAALGVPGVRHRWGPDFMYQARDLEPDLLAPLAERLGVGAVHAQGSLVVDPCPPSLQCAGQPDRQLMRHVPYNGAGRLPSWLLEPRRGPRVCVTWGTSTTRLNAELHLAGEVLGALGDTAAEVVAALSEDDMAHLGPVPDNVRVVRSAPLHLLLPSCDALVGQGGLGTMMAAVTCGLPQLVVPQLPDQRFNAELLAATGAGTVLERADLDRLAAAVAALSTRSVAAQRLQRENAALPTPAEVVPVLERMR